MLCTKDIADVTQLNDSLMYAVTTRTRSVEYLNRLMVESWFIQGSRMES